MAETAKLAAKLRSEGERLLSFFGGIDEKAWAIEVYTENEVWTVRNTMSHLMTTERALRKLFEQVRLGGGGVSEDFVIDRYNASQQRRTAGLSSAELMQSFGEARAETVAWVSGLAEADLDRRGRHPFLGQTSLREMIKMLYLHGQIHYRDVRRALNARTS